MREIRFSHAEKSSSHSSWTLEHEKTRKQREWKGGREGKGQECAIAVRRLFLLVLREPGGKSVSSLRAYVVVCSSIYVVNGVATEAAPSRDPTDRCSTKIVFVVATHLQPLCVLNYVQLGILLMKVLERETLRMLIANA